MKKKILILGMALMLAAGISACNASSKNSSSEATTTESKQADAKAEDSKQAESDKEDKKFPEFTAKTVSGEDISSDLFKDSKLTVVNVWGSWCGPCVQEIPELQKLYESMKDKDVNVIGLAQDAGTDLDAVKEIIDKNKVTYQNIVPEGATEDFVMNLMAFPTTFFVDSDRNIVGVIQGNRNLEAFTAAVEGVLEKLK